jgi:hypothetical protein
MLIWLLLKLLIVILFLVMFLRGARVVWGIGLVTVTTALLLDAFLGTFGDPLRAELGFFFYVLAGTLFAGAALWLWGVLRPLLGDAPAGKAVVPRFVPLEVPDAGPDRPARDPYAGTAFDRQMLFEQIRYRLGPDDVLDLIYDLGLNENDMIAPFQPASAAIVTIMDAAEEGSKTTELALAVERILTPPNPDHLPRLEKIDVSSPPTVLRHYLLAEYELPEVRRLARRLGVDPEQLGDDKRRVVRNLLLYADRRSQRDDLVKLLKNRETG